MLRLAATEKHRFPRAKESVSQWSIDFLLCIVFFSSWTRADLMQFYFGYNSESFFLFGKNLKWSLDL